MKLIQIFFTFLVSSSLFSHGVSESSKSALIDGSFLNYIFLGAEHMLTGYDHLLFLLGVVFFLKSFPDIIRFISAFTLGHCITLIFATYFKITANYFLIDAVIALTVCYKAFENLGVFPWKQSAKTLLSVVFVIGLIHGFGLSTRLQELPLAHEFWGLLKNIFGFNIGVELGQIAALLVMLPILAALRKLKIFSKLSFAINTLLIVLGFMLFATQMNGYLQSNTPTHLHNGVESKEKHEHHHNNHDDDHDHGDHHSHDDHEH